MSDVAEAGNVRCACCGLPLEAGVYDLHEMKRWVTLAPGERLPEAEVVRVHVEAPQACIARAIVLALRPQITVG